MYVYIASGFRLPIEWLVVGGLVAFRRRDSRKKKKGDHVFRESVVNNTGDMCCRYKLLIVNG